MQSENTNQAGAAGITHREGESYARLRDLFVAVSDIDKNIRVAWFDAHVPDADDRLALERLLAADEMESGALEISADEHAARLDLDDSVRPERMIGQSIGSFRLVRMLGQGGMAAVFLGEREGADFEQRAAVKLLRRGLYSEIEQRLFRRERQLLASLDHPNIARLIDGGVTRAGIPYLIIEYIDGESITHFATHRKLSVPERLHLFLVVCRAVEAAHRALIVHRDIKPSNIFVASDGAIKLLDFGIAKLIEDEADASTIAVFTPEYAAPEQFSGSLMTTATDVYALGVLLHELLVGARPQRSPTRRPSSIVNADASDRAKLPKPDELSRALRGDLDTILLKCLRTEADQRYASAGALADDIERHRDGKPVEAHPPSRLYRTRKFVQRHRSSVAITITLVAVIFVALGVALWQAHVARSEADRANSEASRANVVRDFLVSVFDNARAHLPRDKRPTPELLVAQAQQRLSGDTNLDPTTRAAVLRTLGEVDLSLSNFSQAESAFTSALSLISTADDQENKRLLEVLRADAQQRAGRNAEASQGLDAELGSLRSKPSPALVRALAVLAEAAMALGKPDVAIANRREAASVATQIYGEGTIESLAAAFGVGNTLADAQRFPEAIATLEPRLARWRAEYDPGDDRYVSALESLATSRDGVGDVAGSEQQLRDLLVLKQRIYPSPHDAIAMTLRQLADVVARRERYAEAETLANQAMAMDRQIFGKDHEEIAQTFDVLGGIMVAQRRFAEADTDYQAAIAICGRAQIKDEVCPRAHNDLGMSFYRQKQLDDAKREMTEALADRRRLFGNDHPTVASSMSTLANVEVAQTHFAEAAQLSADALAIFERDGLGSSKAAILTRNGYAQALWLTDRNDDALREINRTLVDWDRLFPDGKARRVFILVQKAQILSDLKRDDDAKSTANEAIQVNANASDLSEGAKQVIRKLSGRSDAYVDSNN